MLYVELGDGNRTPTACFYEPTLNIHWMTNRSFIGGKESIRMIIPRKLERIAFDAILCNECAASELISN